MSSEIALLIPAFNAARQLPKLLEAAVEQTTAFQEIILYDDASTDNSAAVAKDYGIRVLSGQTNSGAAVARNRLIAASTAKWLHFHDADDGLSLNFNARMLAALPASNTCLICAAEEVDVKTGQRTALLEWTAVNDYSDQLSFFLKNQCAMAVGLYPRHAVEYIGGFREDLRGGEDYDFHVRLAQSRRLRFRAIADILATVNRGSGRSFTESRRSAYLLDFLKVLKDYAHGLPVNYVRELGPVCIDLAWRLYAINEKEAARVAIRLARSAGREEISSDSRAFRLFSKWFGPEPAFQMRKWRNDLLA